MLSWKKIAVLVILGCGFLLSVGATLAQTNLETNAGIQFNFSTPGAANLALGGAFLALADDATTAYTNPAGLANLVQPEVHFETRSWTYRHVFTDRGRLDGIPPTEKDFDDIEGLRDGEAEDRVNGVSFLSYVLPRKKWTFALYRHELANFEANFESQGAFLELTRSRSLLGIPGELDGRLASLRNHMAIEIVNHGAAVAYRFSPAFSAGVSLSSYRFSLSSTAERFVPPLFDEFDFDRPGIEQEVVNYQQQVGDDSDWGLNAGLFWQSPGEIWSIGAVYRQGPTFGVIARNQPGVGAIIGFAPSERRGTFNVPEVYGVGIAFRPNDAVRISFDYDHVKYSVLTRDFIDVFALEELFISFEDESSQFVIDDAEEFHVGFEYLFYRLKVPFNVRIGAWYDPDHSLRFEGENLSFQAIFRPRSDEMHYSAGIGIYRKRFALDVAFDYSERVSTASLSAVFRL